jgi:hypothetical protein
VTTQAAVRTPRAARTRARAAWRPALVVLAAAGLYLAYWRQSQSLSLSSDGASNVLQAWAMLHGNVLLHGWHVSDVSFYTTELPQYALLASLLGLSAQVVHAAAAMTYLLLVLLAGALAMGPTAAADTPATGPARWPRALLAAAIMAAPQLSATQIVLLSPDHTGTAVPVLVTWLIIDRITPDRWRPARWVVPLLVFILLTWTMAADSIVLLTCIAPLVLAGVLRAGRSLARRGRRSPVRWHELSLAAAAAAAGGLGSAAPRIITALGGFQQAPVQAQTAVGALQHQSWVTFQGLLALFGANVFDAHPPLQAVFVWLHLAGAIVFLAALGLALARFFRSADLLVPAFAAAILVNVASYMFSLHAVDVLGAREIAAVLPFGAVLAGRLLAGPITRRARARTWLRPALGLIAAGYLGTLAYGAAQSPAPPANQVLATWLAAHGLTDGLAGYWQANSTTLASGGRVRVSAVTQAPPGQLVPYEWETDDAAYDPTQRDATFMVTAGPAALPWAQSAALRTFGHPQHTYTFDGYTVMVWNTNLLLHLGHPGLT